MSIKKHNFSFGLTWRDKKKEDHKECCIYLFYSYGSKHTKQSTNVKIPKGAWNDKKKEIDIDNYPFLIEQQKALLNIWKNKFEMTNKLKSGKVSRITAFEEITERVPNETLRDFFVKKYRNTPKMTLSSYNARLGTLNAIENGFKKLGHRELAPITFDMMSDVNTLEKMYTIMQNEFEGLSTRGLYEYTRVLDSFYNKRYRKASPFATNELKPSYEEPEKTGIEYNDLLNGIAKIRTIQDLETYLFYLYSFALRGLNGKDIFRMRDKDFVFGTNEEHYIPEVSDENYMEKIYYQKVRGKRRNKTSRKMKILANLYPVNHIREWLKWCVDIERPELAREDNEGYAIFRKFSEKDIERIWANNLRTTYKNKAIKLFGKGIGSARHTYTQTGLDAGVPYEKLQASIGHTPTIVKRTSVKKYARYTEQEFELIQAEVYDEMNLIDIFHTLYDFLKDKKPYRAETFIPKDLKLTDIDFYMKDKGKLTITGWSYLEEFKMRKMMKKYDDRERFEAIRKGLIKKSISKSGYVSYYQKIGRKASIPMPKELADLVKRKEKLQEKNKRSFLDRILG